MDVGNNVTSFYRNVLSAKVERMGSFERFEFKVDMQTVICCHKSIKDMKLHLIFNPNDDVRDRKKMATSAT